MAPDFSYAVCRAGDVPPSKRVLEKGHAASLCRYNGCVLSAVGIAACFRELHLHAQDEALEGAGLFLPPDGGYSAAAVDGASFQTVYAAAAAAVCVSDGESLVYVGVAVFHGAPVHGRLFVDGAVAR